MLTCGSSRFAVLDLLTLRIGSHAYSPTGPLPGVKRPKRRRPPTELLTQTGPSAFWWSAILSVRGSRGGRALRAPLILRCSYPDSRALWWIGDVVGVLEV